jgi:hypothetical protein
MLLLLKRGASSFPRMGRALTAVVIVQGYHPHCVGADIELAYHRFALSSCPDTAFTLPRELSQPPYQLSSRHEPLSSTTTAVCPGFQTYRLRPQSEGDRVFSAEVRLNRAGTCSLDIGWAYTRQPDRPDDPSEQVIPLVETVARLLMQNSSADPIMPAASVERFGSTADARRWCAQQTLQE